ncbi:MAG: hypothetical protein ACK2U9_00520 [Anaerolineae bacterium]|jgi:hypothetical protein
MQTESTGRPGVYLVVEFNWPRPVQPGHGQDARALHDAIQGQTWLAETVAASGGLGGGPSSIWIFRLENYGALDRLLGSDDDPVALAYRTFFSQMVDVSERIREPVLFRRS